MAVSTSATSSGQKLCAVALTTTLTTVLYTSPNSSTLVTSPSATAYVKEIILANTTSSAISVTLGINGVTILGAISINANDTKIIGGLNTMIDPNGTVTGGASATGVNCLISGVVVQ